MNKSICLNFLSTILLFGKAYAAPGPEIVSSSQKEIRQVVNANMVHVKQCYVDSYYNGHKPNVMVSLAITTDGWGKVSAVKLIDVVHSLKRVSPKPFLKCLILSIYKWQFPITGAKSRRFVQDFQIGA